MRAYIYDNSDLDQREPHDSGVDATLDDLKAIGVLYWKFDGPNALQQINDLAVERKYKNRDEITVSPDSLGAVYEEKVKSFFTEHLHEDEEIRYIQDGTGYFDVRDKSDTWIRIAMGKGDMIILVSKCRTAQLLLTLCLPVKPAGMYHRFTTDSKNYLKAMRLFKEDPLWTPINRPLADDNTHRTSYLSTFNITAP